MASRGATSAACSYTLTAVAEDDSGARTTSAPVSIVVTPPNQPPAVAIVSPVHGATFSAPATFTIAATASDADGAVAEVRFFAGPTLVGTDSTNPFTLTIVDVAAGTYTLTAAAQDDDGTTTTSDPVSITVVPTWAACRPSADHDTIVDSYLLEIFTEASDPDTATPAASQNLGKPAVVDDQISIDATGIIQGLAPGTYFATVTAVGADGSARSAPSNVFAR